MASDKTVFQRVQEWESREVSNQASPSEASSTATTQPTHTLRRNRSSSSKKFMKKQLPPLEFSTSPVEEDQLNAKMLAQPVELWDKEMVDLVYKVLLNASIQNPSNEARTSPLQASASMASQRTIDSPIYNREKDPKHWYEQCLEYFGGNPREGEFYFPTFVRQVLHETIIGFASQYIIPPKALDGSDINIDHTFNRIIEVLYSAFIKHLGIDPDQPCHTYDCISLEEAIKKVSDLRGNPYTTHEDYKGVYKLIKRYDGELIGRANSRDHKNHNDELNALQIKLLAYKLITSQNSERLSQEFEKLNIEHILKEAQLPFIKVEKRSKAMRHSTITTGGAGSGKSTTVQHQRQKFDRDTGRHAIAICSDMFKHSLFLQDEYSYEQYLNPNNSSLSSLAHAESSWLSSRVRDHIHRKLRETGAGPDVIIETITVDDRKALTASDGGGTCTLSVVTSNTDIAVRRIGARRLRTAREVDLVTALRLHKESASHIPTTIQHHRNLRVELTGTDLPLEEQTKELNTVLIARMDTSCSILYVYDLERFIAFIQKKHINIYAQNEASLLPKDYSTSQQVKDMMEYVKGGHITIQLIDKTSQAGSRRYATIAYDKVTISNLETFTAQFAKTIPKQQLAEPRSKQRKAAACINAFMHYQHQKGQHLEVAIFSKNGCHTLYTTSGPFNPVIASAEALESGSDTALEELRHMHSPDRCAQLYDAISQEDTDNAFKLLTVQQSTLPSSPVRNITTAREWIKNGYTHLHHAAILAADGQPGKINMLNLVFRYAPTDVNQTTRSGKTPLVRAAWYNNVAACEFLLENGANPHGYHTNSLSTDGQREPILQRAATAGRAELCFVLTKNYPDSPFKTSYIIPDSGNKTIFHELARNANIHPSDTPSAFDKMIYFIAHNTYSLPPNNSLRTIKDFHFNRDSLQHVMKLLTLHDHDKNTVAHEAAGVGCSAIMQRLNDLNNLATEYNSSLQGHSHERIPTISFHQVNMGGNSASSLMEIDRARTRTLPPSLTIPVPSGAASQPSHTAPNSPATWLDLSGERPRSRSLQHAQTSTLNSIGEEEGSPASKPPTPPSPSR